MRHFISAHSRCVPQPAHHRRPFFRAAGAAGGLARLAGAAAVARGWGDCFGYLLVATGRAEVMCDPVMSPWDAAALQPIIEEAGGHFTDWTGAATAFGGSVVATNRALGGVVREMLAQPSGN